MPTATSKKPLHLGQSIGDLNKEASKIPPVTSAQLFIKSADKVFKAAEENNLLGDEETAYVLFMKYFNLITAIKKSKDYKKNQKYCNELIGKKNSFRAITEAEKLAASLKDRYDEKEAEKVVKKLEIAEKKRESAEASKLNEKNGEEKDIVEDEEKSKEKEEKNTEKTEKVSDQPTVQDYSVSALDLIKYLLDAHMSVILMDMRSTADYDNSHIQHKLCINVPADIVIPGTTSERVSLSLQDQYKLIWNQRDSVDFIVLLDYKSSAAEGAELFHPLKSLTDALYKWDTKVVKSHPIILDGGYNTWLWHYPTFTTNPKVDKVPLTSSNVTTVPSLEKIDYDVDLDFLKDPEPAPVNQPSQFIRPGMPSIDRSKKPDVVRPQTTLHKELEKMNINDVNNTQIHTQSEKTNNIEHMQTINNNMNTTTKVNNINNVPHIPRVNRSLKPKVDSMEQNGGVGGDYNVMNNSLNQQTEAIKKSNAILVEEHRAKRAQLEQDQQDIEEVMSKKRQELKETAEVLREKKRLQAELEALKMQQQEQLEKNKLVENFSKLEDHSVHKPASIHSTPEKTTPKNTSPAHSSPAHSTSADQKSVPESSSSPAKQNTEDLLAKQKELERAKQEELERVKQQEEALRAKIVAEERQARIDQEKRKEERRKDAERKAREMKEYEQKEKDRLEAERLRKEKNRLDQEKVAQERQRESERVALIAQRKREEANRGVYRMPLKDDNDIPASGGMKRSHSSPNIAKISQDEGNQPIRSLQPHHQPVNRTPKKTEVSAAKVRNLQPTWGSVGTGLTGLRNMGNTCYMNSVIQCLSSNSMLASYVITDGYLDHLNRENILGTGGRLAEEFAVVIKALWCGQYKSVTPRDFKSTVSRFNSMFAGYEQHDSQEFLLFLMDGLHEDMNQILNRPKLPEQNNDNLPDHVAADRAWEQHKRVNKSIIVELFQGLFKSTLTCLTCSKQSVTFDVFMYLSVPIPSNSRCSLRDCLQEFAREERMKGDSRWFCPQCKCKRDAVKRIVIWKLPHILLIHLKRFYYQGVWRQKITSNVDFPITDLNMSVHTAGPEEQVKRRNYNLYAISNHYGTMEGGHYTAFCKNPNRQNWYKYDDHEVYEISTNDIRSPAAFILFYSCRDMKPMHQ